MGSVSNEGKRRQLRRLIRRRQRGAVELGQQADIQIEKLLLRRFDRLLSVKRFVLLWVLLFVVLMVTSVVQTRSLSGYYQALKPAPGGIYSEGIIGTFTNANPIYASGKVDRAVSRIVFSGLLKYDTNNQLTGDLAESWSQGPASTHYVVKLRHNIKWHDGQPFTADDVLFTYDTIKNPVAQSPLYTSWKDIKVSKQDNFTVSFDLPTALSSFPYAITNGILPNHLLKSVPPQQLRSAPFNTQPVGTGPFIWKFIELSGTPGIDLQQNIRFTVNQKYFAGKPKLDGFGITAYFDEKRALGGFKNKQINALAGLESLPGYLAKDASVKAYETPLTTAVMAFFNTSHQPLSDVNVRKALVSSVDRTSYKTVSGATVNLVDGPFLHGQLGYDPSIIEPGFEPTHANQLLDAAGWGVIGADGFRTKDGQTLQLTMRSQNTPQYTAVAQSLQKQWQKVGVKINVQYYDADELQGSIIASHDYDILLYGINIGVDPDVFAYWDSSQATITSAGHLNLSEYKSSAADASLEGARTRSDPALRSVKLRPFLSAWVNDAPAIALYQPNFLYVTRGPVFNYERKSMNTPTDRYFNVNDWMIRQSRQNI